jgi:hypothetical protein
MAKAEQNEVLGTNDEDHEEEDDEVDEVLMNKPSSMPCATS